MSELTLTNVSYIYSAGTPFEKKALDGVNIKFRPGLITGLIGHTGSGKSTLVQLLNGLLKPTSGTVALDGKDIWAEPKKIRDVRFRVGLCFQYPEYQLFEETVRRDIAFGPCNRGLSDTEVAFKVHEAADFVGLATSLLDKSPFELSGGEKRRVAIAGILAMDPDILVLDEPAAGLDPLGREDIFGGVRRYQKERQKTVIIVSHSMEDMARYSDELVVMNSAEIFMTGTTAEIFRQAETLVKVGLDVPQITRLVNLLRKNGVALEGDIFTVDAACEAIAAKLGLAKTGMEAVCLNILLSVSFSPAARRSTKPTRGQR